MALFREIFFKANLECYRVVKQQHFPKVLFSVYMFVLKPKIKVNPMEDSENITNTSDFMYSEIEDKMNSDASTKQSNSVQEA